MKGIAFNQRKCNIKVKNDRRRFIMIHDSALLTTAEAAVYLRYSASTIYLLIHKKEIQAIKRGKSYLVLRTSLDNYIKVHLSNKK